MKTTIVDNPRDLTYIRKVYAWLGVGAGLTAAVSWLALNVGGTVFAKVEDKYPEVPVPAAVGAICNHPVTATLLFLLLAFATVMMRRVRDMSGILYFLFTGFSGFFIGPALFVAQWKAAHHVTLSAHPIRDSAALTGAMFLGLTTYAWTSKRDFSWMEGMLYTGLWVIIVAGLLNVFVGSTAFQLAISSVAVLLFAGYVLFDTAVVVHKSNGDDAIGDALNLYLDVFNIFLSLLNITSSKRD